ncbi:EthD family reductase [Paludifilum halophilum]|uniref:Ethyl tert-butyl ether degradation protein EthD n=1 Tax=Paludifilum halophilum TaxID=1642702 RepID=A0A235B441_9BACL|nr:EthD family reductase [Paludifilum halophilum]OYD07068.1 ethyl tert-butyl ether degradation protein EthD [Paludifilum halophilum]
MVKLIALYQHPDNKESFDDHYQKVHTPLVKKMPGLKRLEVTKMQGAPMGGEAKYYLEAAMYFDSREALDAAMNSPEGKATAKDLMGFAGSLVTMMIGEVTCSE